MNHLKYIGVLLSVLFFVTSCRENVSNDNQKLEIALSLSGQNRVELEKVLTHYSSDEKDSLKLKAAQFLIANMPYHVSLSGECIENQIKISDTLYRDIPLPIRSIYYMIPARVDSLKSCVTREADIEKITADFLIKNIDYSFDSWEKSIYEPRISFEDFCEYVLPYKHSEEPLILWKDTIRSLYDRARYLDIYEINMTATYSLYANSYLHFVPYNKLFMNNEIYSQSDNSRYRTYTELASKRGKGVPTAIDFIPFINADYMNYWIITIDRKYLGESYGYMNADFSSKVFRKTYSLNLVPDDPNNFVPDFIRDPHNRDITTIYQNVTTVDYDFGDVPSNVKYAYLAVFYGGEWCEVSWSELKNGKASFQNMGRDVVYMPLYYNGNVKICSKNAILLDRNGRLSDIGIVEEKKENVVMERVSAYTISGRYNSKSFIGATITASNTAEVLKFDTLATITHSKYNGFDTVNVNNDKKYKYLALNSKNYLYICELQFFDCNGKQLRGKVIRINKDKKISEEPLKYNKIFDDNILTYSTMDGAFGLLLERPAVISYVKYMPQNDRCGIMPGNEYELFYFHNGEWVSLVKKVATDYKIEFENIPTDALLWVHDHGKKCDERPFTISNGKLKFW